MLKPFNVKHTNPSPSHVVIEMFAGDNNLSRYVAQDMVEMRHGNGGNFVTLALTDYATREAAVIEVSPRFPNRLVERLDR